MRIPQFEHVAPTQLEEACSFLAAYDGNAVALAGGTDMLVKMKQRKVVPRYVVNLKKSRASMASIAMRTASRSAH